MKIKKKQAKVLQDCKQEFYSNLLKSDNYWYSFKENKLDKQGFCFSSSKGRNKANEYYTDTFIINTNDEKFVFDNTDLNKQYLYIGYNYLYGSKSITPQGVFTAQQFDRKADIKKYHYANLLMINGNILFDGKNYPELTKQINIKNLSKQINKIIRADNHINNFLIINISF